MVVPSDNRRRLRMRRDQLHPDPNQPRKVFPQNKLMELAGSWRAMGQLQDVIACEHKDLPSGHGLIVDGHRRWSCMPFVPTDEVSVTLLPQAPSAVELLKIQLSLGATCEKLNPFEVADGCQRLEREEPSLSREMIAETIGISPSKLSKVMGINEWLALPLRADVEAGLIPFSVAAALSRLRDNVAMQVELAAAVKAGLLKRDAVEARVSAVLHNRPRTPKPMKLAFGGVAMTVTGNAIDALRALQTKLGDVLKKIDREGWGPDFLSGLMK